MNFVEFSTCKWIKIGKFPSNNFLDVIMVAWNEISDTCNFLSETDT